MKDWKSFELTLVRKQVAPIGIRVESPNQMASLFKKQAIEDTQESLYTVVFNGRNDVIGIVKVYQGTATGTSVAVHEIIRPAILMGSVAIAIAHNHPSGDHKPSDEDIRLTEEILNAGRYLDITLLDHLVISDMGYTSIRSQRPGMWKDEFNNAIGSARTLGGN